MTPTPICAFDISSDGQATAIADLGAPPPSPESWRWLHFDLNDPDLPGWIKNNLPTIPARAMLASETRPRCERHEGGIILNLRGVNVNPRQNPDDMVSLRLWVVDDLIVSARMRKIFAVDEIRNEAASLGRAPASPAEFLARLADNLTNRIEGATRDLGEKTDDMEDSGDTSALRDIRASVIKFRRYIGPQQTALDDLAKLDMPILPKSARQRLRETGNRTLRSVEELDALSARLTAMQDHITTEQAARQAHNGYILSIVAAIFLPLGFLTGLFGVNVAGMPGIDWPWAFAVLALLSVVIGVLLYVLLRLMRWF